MARTSRTKKELENENLELRDTLESVYDQLADALGIDEGDEDEGDEDEEDDEDD